MPCALCLQEAELRRSHIIPEFLYETLYDDKRRLHMLSIIPEQSNWLEQKGLRERLLCTTCEQRLSVWERYASLVLKGGLPLTYRRKGNVVFISGLDYAQFKLFQLSILWRTGVSSLQFFEKVQLGKHAELLRRQLLVGDPGSPERYGCFMFGLKFDDQAFTGVIVQPGKVRLNGHTAYRFVFGGFLWALLVSSHDLGAPLNQCTLSSSGETVLLIRDAKDMKNLVSFSVELGRMGREPPRRVLTPPSEPTHNGVPPLRSAHVERYCAKRSLAYLAGCKSPSGKGQPPTRIECCACGGAPEW